jgi:hypothetical protein
MAINPTTLDSPVRTIQAADAPASLGSGRLFSIRHVNPTAGGDDAVVTQGSGGDPLFTSKAKAALSGEVQYYPLIPIDDIYVATLDSGFLEVVCW